MPIVIEGYVVASVATLAEHRGHDIVIADTDPRVDGPRRLALACDACGVRLATEPEPSTSLPCGCATADDHAGGIAIQGRMRKAYRFPRSTCVGCALGDDGPSIHSCYVHPIGV